MVDSSDSGVLLDTSSFAGELSQQDLDSLVGLNYQQHSNMLMQVPVSTINQFEKILLFLININSKYALVVI